MSAFPSFAALFCFSIRYQMHFSVVFHMEIQVKIIRFLFFSGLYYDFIVIYTYFSPHRSFEHDDRCRHKLGHA